MGMSEQPQGGGPEWAVEQKKKGTKVRQEESASLSNFCAEQEKDVMIMGEKGLTGDTSHP